MTTLLQNAFAKAEQLTPEEQDVLAARLLSELSAEDDFDRAIAASENKLSRLAQEALVEYQAGETLELDPETL